MNIIDEVSDWIEIDKMYYLVSPVKFCSVFIFTISLFFLYFGFQLQMEEKY